MRIEKIYNDKSTHKYQIPIFVSINIIKNTGNEKIADKINFILNLLAWFFWGLLLSLINSTQKPFDFISEIITSREIISGWKSIIAWEFDKLIWTDFTHLIFSIVEVFSATQLPHVIFVIIIVFFIVFLFNNYRSLCHSHRRTNDFMDIWLSIHNFIYHRPSL